MRDKNEKQCIRCGQFGIDYEMAGDLVYCRLCWNKLLDECHRERIEHEHGYYKERSEKFDMLEHQYKDAIDLFADLKRERDEYLDLLDEAFVLFSGMGVDVSIDDNGIMHMRPDGWFDDNESSTLRDISAALAQAGRLERHPSNKRLYRRIAREGGKE